MDTREITADLLPAFRPYLLPEAAQLLEEGDPRIVALGAVTEDFHTCGAAAALRDEEGFTLFSLYVDPQIRRQGVATLLVRQVEVLGKQPLSRAEWVLPDSGLAPLAALLDNHGFGPPELDGGGILRLDTRVMRTLPMVRRAFAPQFRPDPNILPVSGITRAEREELLADQSIDPRLRLDRFSDAQLAAPTSLAYRYGGRIAAYFLAEPTADGAAILAAVSRQGCHAGAFLQLALAAIHSSLPYLPGGEGFYWLEAINDTAEQLARHFSGGEPQLWRSGRAQRLA